MAVASLTLALVDKLTGPLKGVNKALGSVQRAIDQNNRQLDAMRGRMVEAAAVGFGLYKALSTPISAAAAFETKMLDIGQKADLSDTAIASLSRRIRTLAGDLGASASGIAGGVDTLMGLGASENDAMGLIAPITKAVSAYGASFEEMAQAGYSALDNLKVPANQFGRALDSMAQAGKAGAFELKDMARYFPTLGAAYQGLKQTGVPAVADLASALQIVRKGTGDSASAATNLGNLLQKISSPGTVKNFAKLGVNLRREMAKLQASGMTPIEAIATLTNKVLKGDLSRLGYLFEDSQVQQALRPLIQNMEEYRKIRAEALKAQGVVEEDFQRRSKTSAARMAAFRAAVENISIAIGNALIPALNSVLDAIGPVAMAFEKFADANPAIIRAITGVVTSLIAFRVGTVVARFAALYLKGAILQVALVALKAARGLLMLLNPIKLVTGALALLRGVFLFSGVGAILMGIGLAGAFIYNNWEGVSAAFSGFGEAFMAALGPAGGMLQPVIEGAKSIWGWLKQMVGPLDITKEKWKNWGGNIGRNVGDFIRDIPGSLRSINWSALGASASNALSGLGRRALTALQSVDWSGLGSRIVTNLSQTFQNIPNLIKSINWMEVGETVGRLIGDAIAGLLNLGAWLIDSITSADGGGTSLGGAVVHALIAGVRATWDLFAGVLKGLFSNISLYDAGVAMARSLLSGLVSIGNFGVETPQLITPGTNPDPANDNIGKRASGGPVQAFKPYLVGERGPELIVPAISGVVMSARETAAMMRLNLPRASSTPVDAMTRAMANARTPSGGTGRQFGGGGPISVSFGDINIQGGANVTSQQIRRDFSREASLLLRNYFSDGLT